MSTRGVIGFRLRDKDLLAYNHSDSYPDYLGTVALRFIQDGIRAQGYDDWLGTIKQRAGNLIAVDPDVAPTDEQKKALAGYTDTHVGGQSTDDWYCLLRDTQGDLDKMLTARFFEPNDSFMLDSLFCEWAYVINLDSEELEVYKGFQPAEGDLPGRYRRMPPLPVPDHREKNEYGAVALALALPFKTIATAETGAMVALMEEQGEDPTRNYLKQLEALAAAFAA